VNNMYDLAERDLIWIRKLNSEIWKKEYTYATKWSDGWDTVQNRMMTPWEYLWVFRIASTHQLPCVMANNMTSMAIYHHHDLPTFNRRRVSFGEPESAPEKLITITPYHLHCTMSKDRYNMVTKKYPKGVPPYYHSNRFGRLFSRLTHSDWNRRMLEWYGFEKPREKKPKLYAV